MSTAALKRELALLRSSLAALTPAQSATLDDPVAWAERIAGLTLDPWQRRSKRRPSRRRCDEHSKPPTKKLWNRSLFENSGGLKLAIPPRSMCIASGSVLCSLFVHFMANDPRSPPARSPERSSLAWLSQSLSPALYACTRALFSFRPLPACQTRSPSRT